jgi:hypothetical protein
MAVFEANHAPLHDAAARSQSREQGAHVRAQGCATKSGRDCRFERRRRPEGRATGMWRVGERNQNESASCSPKIKMDPGQRRDDERRGRELCASADPHPPSGHPLPRGEGKAKALGPGSRLRRVRDDDNRKIVACAE